MHSRSARAFCFDMYAEDLCPSWQHIALARIESGARCAAGFLASSRPLGVKSRHYGRGTDVRYYPESDRNSDRRNSR